MFLLRPDRNDLESFEKTYGDLFKSDKDKCFSSKNNKLCTPFYFYGSCYDDSCTIKSFSYKCHCLYSNKLIKATCDNGTYNLTPEYLFQYCEMPRFIEHIYLLHKIDMIYQPISLLIILSSIFKLYRFDEIKNDFQWSLVIYLLFIQSSEAFIRFINTMANNSSLVFYICSFYLMLKIYSNAFLYVLALITTLYLYGILVYVDTQLNTLRQSLYYIAFTAPLFEAGIVAIFDSLLNNHSFITCRMHSLNAKVAPEEFLLTNIILIVVVLLSMKIKICVRTTKITNEGKEMYRVEYDILGNREEVSFHYIYELMYCQKNQIVLLVFYYGVIFLSMLLLNINDARLISPALIMLHLKDIILLLYIIEVIWRNPELNILFEALEKWYSDTDEEIENRFENNEFMKEISKLLVVYTANLESDLDF